MSSLNSQYSPTGLESRIYESWLQSNFFSPELPSLKEKYCIMIPPPNVTGVLHMGHALTVTLEDILIRRKRMGGFNTLWLPGTDHAGIATQMVVEKKIIAEEKKTRHDLGREDFLKRVWEWKETSQNTILSQLKLMGCSVDWSRLRFTLDEGLSHSVREAFVRLYKDGLIFRDEAMTSSCPRCRTVLSDLEVKLKEVNGSLWHIGYRLKKDPSKYLVVATTRPETLLGDTAVAIHPEDERFKAFRGQKVLVPIIQREVPVIEDPYVDRTFGTGALKITPAHDANDYAIGKKWGLQSIKIFNDAAMMNENAGPFKGLSREEARKKILIALEKESQLIKEVPTIHQVGHCDRCGTMVEPALSLQWFIDAQTLAVPAIQAVENKTIKIIPQEWEKTYFEWMRNIRPWCISRQLWWGHRIPVWYCLDCQNVCASVTDVSFCTKCNSKNIKQDEDVLDTWFSSGLWPFSTLGWPKETNDFKAFYPTDVLETGFDILFFWVARMIMLGLRMTGKIPFHTVYLHPMVRDEHGQKMSKTKGNVKDPLDIVNRCGADTLRFTLASLAVHGRDVVLTDSRIEGYRNFINKIWNASRFVLMHFSDIKQSKWDRDNEINLWIWFRLNLVKKEVNLALDEYRFFDAAEKLYHFFWHEYCDWFLEFIKTESELLERKKNKDSTAIEVLEESLRLLHPIMPFVTEEIWQSLPLRENKPSIMVSTYPKPADTKEIKSSPHVEKVISIIEGVRSKRGEVRLSPGTQIGISLWTQSKSQMDPLKKYEPLFKRMCQASSITFLDKKPDDLKPFILAIEHDVQILIPKGDLLNVGHEKERVEKELNQIEAELSRANFKLSNQEFCQKAPQNVITGVRERKLVLEKKAEELKKYLETILESSK